MGKEDNYIYQSFSDNFIKRDKGNVVIYGTGVHTGELVGRLDEGDICGIMDLNQTGKELYGYKVLSEDEVKCIPNVCIVILARDAVINIVYRKIEAFCDNNHIDVFDISGNLLGVGCKECEEACFMLDINELKEKISEADAVTFDVFDTLIVRKVFKESDVFKLISFVQNEIKGSYVDIRKKAEDKAWAEENNPTIYDIYQQIEKMLHIPEDINNKLLELEVQVEKQILCKRLEVCNIMDQVIQDGKKVYLISDMYLPKEILRDILDDVGIEGYTDLFVSCDYGVSKQEGLYNIVKDIICPDDNTILHIGDNYYSDIVSAQDAGFNTFQIYSCREMFERSIYSEIIPEPQCLKDSIILGQFILNAFSDPFGKYYPNGKLLLYDFQKIIRLFIAPIISEYIFFLSDQIKKKEIEYVVFPSRDGWLLKRMYETLNMQKGVFVDDIYLYTSRRSALVASAISEEDVMDILNVEDSRTLDAKIYARFGKKRDNSDKILTDTEIEDLLEVCRHENSNYTCYLKSEGMFTVRKTAFIDFVAIGTVQEALERILGRRLYGIYFLRRATDKIKFSMLDIEAFYGEKEEFGEKDNIIFWKIYYLLRNLRLCILMMI